MPEHFTKSTGEAKFWCSKCGGPTMHTVADGRRGSCLKCLAKLEAKNTAAKLVPPAARQESLF